MTETRARAARARRRRGLFWVAILVAAVWVAADQLTKWWAESALTRGQSQDFIPGFMEFRLIYNPGAAFSFATNATALLTVFAVGVVVFLIVMARRLESMAWTIALGLLLGGAAGNLVDRLFRDPGPGRGHVVDFLRFENFPFIDFPIFNVADIGVTTAAISIILLALFGVAPDGGPRPEDESNPGEDNAANDDDGGDGGDNDNDDSAADDNGDENDITDAASDDAADGDDGDESADLTPRSTQPGSDTRDGG